MKTGYMEYDTTTEGTIEIAEIATGEIFAVSNDCGIYNVIFKKPLLNIENNDNDVGKKELVSEIQYWNSDLAYRKTIQRDFWVGIYYPNVYDQFEFIKLNKGVDYKVENSQEDD